LCINQTCLLCALVLRSLLPTLIGKEMRRRSEELKMAALKTTWRRETESEAHREDFRTEFYDPLYYKTVLEVLPGLHGLSQVYWTARFADFT